MHSFHKSRPELLVLDPWIEHLVGLGYEDELLIWIAHKKANSKTNKQTINHSTYLQPSTTYNIND